MRLYIKMRLMTCSQPIRYNIIILLYMRCFVFTTREGAGVNVRVQ